MAPVLTAQDISSITSLMGDIFSANAGLVTLIVGTLLGVVVLEMIIGAIRSK